MGLNLKRRTKRVLPKRLAQPLEVLAQVNHQWALDFMHDTLYCGKRYRTLNIVDEGTRECLAIEVDTSLPAERVVRTLEQLKTERGLPQQRRVDKRKRRPKQPTLMDAHDLRSIPCEQHACVFLRSIFISCSLANSLKIISLRLTQIDSEPGASVHTVSSRGQMRPVKSRTTRGIVYLLSLLEYIVFLILDIDPNFIDFEEQRNHELQHTLDRAFELDINRPPKCTEEKKELNNYRTGLPRLSNYSTP